MTAELRDLLCFLAGASPGQVWHTVCNMVLERARALLNAKADVPAPWSECLQSAVDRIEELTAEVAERSGDVVKAVEYGQQLLENVHQLQQEKAERSAAAEDTKRLEQELAGANLELHQLKREHGRMLESYGLLEQQGAVKDETIASYDARCKQMDGVVRELKQKLDAADEQVEALRAEHAAHTPRPRAPSSEDLDRRKGSVDSEAACAEEPAAAAAHRALQAEVAAKEEECHELRAEAERLRAELYAVRAQLQTGEGSQSVRLQGEVQHWKDEAQRLRQALQAKTRARAADEGARAQLAAVLAAHTKNLKEWQGKWRTDLAGRRHQRTTGCVDVFFGKLLEQECAGVVSWLEQRLAHLQELEQDGSTEGTALEKAFTRSMLQLERTVTHTQALATQHLHTMGRRLRAHAAALREDAARLKGEVASHAQETQLQLTTLRGAFLSYEHACLKDSHRAQKERDAAEARLQAELDGCYHSLAQAKVDSANLQYVNELLSSSLHRKTEEEKRLLEPEAGSVMAMSSFFSSLHAKYTGKSAGGGRARAGSGPKE